MKTRTLILIFFLLAAGCTVQLYPPVKKIEPLPPAQVEPVSVTPDGGVVVVNGDTIPQEYSARKRFYWEQIERSDSTQSFAVTNGSKDGRWLRGDSMRWHTSGPFVTVMTDTVATRAYSRSILDGNGIISALPDGSVTIQAAGQNNPLSIEWPITAGGTNSYFYYDGKNYNFYGGSIAENVDVEFIVPGTGAEFRAEMETNRMYMNGSSYWNELAGDTTFYLDLDEVAFPQIGYMSADSVVVVNSQNRIGKMAVADIAGTPQTIDTLSYDNTTGILSASLSSDGVAASAVDLDRYYNPGKIPYSDGSGFLTTGNVNYNTTPSYTNGLLDIVNTSVWTAGLSLDFDGDTTANNGVTILPKSGYGQEVNFFNIGTSGGTTNIISNVMNGDPGLGGSFSDYAHLGFFVVRRTGNEVDGIANDATRYVTGKPAYIFNNGNNLAPQVLGVGVGDSPLSGGHNIAIYRRDSTVDNSASFPPYNFLYTNYGGVVMSAPGTKFPVTNPLGGTNQLQAALDSLNANLPGDPQYAQSYNEGGENTSVTAGTPEQVISTTLGTTDTIAATSEFTVQSDADIQYTGSNDAVIKITAEAAIDPSSSVYALYYIAINGVIQNSSRFRVYSPGTSIQPMSVNITFIDTDADNGDVYSLYVDSTGGTIGYTVYDFRLTAEKIK